MRQRSALIVPPFLRRKKIPGENKLSAELYYARSKTLKDDEKHLCIENEITGKM